MKKRFLLAVLVLAIGLSLTACWPGEVGITTVFEKDGSGTRTIVLDVMDDSLSDVPIINPDDPDEDEGKGPVLNDVQITGGVEAIQPWLEDNAPDFITVENMTTEGYHRYFTMTYSWDDFDEFLTQYETLVDLATDVSWADFTAAERPTFTSEGLYSKTVTFTESKAVVEASLLWALEGIWNDIYDEAGLSGFVTINDISVLAGYTVTIGEETFEELGAYDAEAEEGNDAGDTGMMVYVESTEFTLAESFSNIGMIIGTVVVAVAAIAGVAFVVLRAKK